MRFVKSRHWLLIIAGTLIWSLTMVKSGWEYKYGLGFWGANGHDGVWHVALIESLSKGKWDMPIFAGEIIKNYHLGFDLALAIIHRLTFIPVPLLYWQLTPPLLALAIGWLTYKLTRNYWSVFFVYFGGSWGWILGKGESVFWSQQAISTLINPPLALSLVLLLVGLLLMQKQKYILAGLIFAVLPHVKIYAGALGFLGLLVASLKNKKLIWVFLGSLVAYLATNYQLLTTSSSLIVWQPGWFLETMMSYSDRVGWTRFYSAMTNYRLSNNWIKAIPAYSVAFGVFIFGNLGTRVLGICATKKFSWIEVFMFTVITGGIVFPMFFLQSGTPWNTIQFFYYSLFFSGILAGIALSKVKSRLVIILVVALTLPTTWQMLKHYLPSRPPAKLSVEEVQALQFLSTQPKGVVLTYPYDAKSARAAESNPPRALYQYESTAYVSAFSKQSVYMEDEVNLNITGYDWMSRRNEATEFFNTRDSKMAQDFLIKNKIKYLYLHNVSQSRPLLSPTDLGMKNTYENSQTAIWANDYIDQRSDPGIMKINMYRSYYPNQLLARALENKVWLASSRIVDRAFKMIDPNIYLFGGHPRE